MKYTILVALAVACLTTSCDYMAEAVEEPILNLQKDTVRVVQIDTVFVNRPGYEDPSPELVTSSEVVQILYRKCANEIYIGVPDLGDAYNPIFKASKAGISPSGQSKGKLRVFPYGKKITISVQQVGGKGSFDLGEVTYQVIDPPKPTIEMTVNGRIYNGISVVSKTSQIGVRLIPDPDFKRTMPQDAKYGINIIEVLAQLSLGPPTKVNTLKGSNDVVNKPINFELGNKILLAKPGTQVYIRLVDIYRVNAKGQKITEKKFSSTEKTLGLVVK